MMAENIGGEIRQIYNPYGVSIGIFGYGYIKELKGIDYSIPSFGLRIITARMLQCWPQPERMYPA
jgi:hypothetical protein